MINETLIFLSQLEDCSEHKVAKYMPGHLVFDVRQDINFYKPLQQVFSKVIPYDYVKRMAEIGVQGVQEEVIELVRKERPKYVLWLTATYEFQESTFARIRKEGSIVVGWMGDDTYSFEPYSKWWIPHLDYFQTHDIEAVPKYEALGARVILTMACEGVPIERDWSNIEERYDVSFVGAKTKPGREQYINELRNRGIPVQVFGREWGRYVPFEEMMDIFITSKINLNFSRATDSERKGPKGRTALICLAGGFLLTEYAPVIEKYFEIDKEVVCFNDTEEMIEKIHYYLNHEEERQAIAQAGWRRATGEYTPFLILSRVFDEIEKAVAENDKKPQPQELKMPKWIRKSPSKYYFDWGKAFLEANYKGLWKDALETSLSYNPYNLGARYYSIISLLPSFTRPPFFWLYKPYQAVERMYRRLCSKLLIWADSIPYLNNLKRSVARRFYYT